MLLKDYFGQSCEGWFASIKRDGWRLLWNGSDFILRGGSVLDVPAEWKAGMPAIALDGELDPGIGNFNRIQGMIRDGFHGLTFAVFDIPGPGTFSQRLKMLQRVPLPSHCELVHHWRIDGPQAVWEEANRICDEGGEGLVIRNPRGLYRFGERSDDVLRMVPADPALNRKRVA